MMWLTLCGYCCKDVESVLHQWSERCQASHPPFERSELIEVRGLRREDTKEIRNLSIPGLGLLRLVTPLRHGQSLSVKFWHSKGKLQLSYSTSHNSDRLAYASLDMDGSVQETDLSAKHSQQSFRY